MQTLLLLLLLQLHPTTRKGEGEGRAASLREGKVIAGVAAWAVGAMTSLLLRVIMYTEGTTERWTERPISNLLQCSLRSPWRR